MVMGACRCVALPYLFPRLACVDVSVQRNQLTHEEMLALFDDALTVERIDPRPEAAPPTAPASTPTTATSLPDKTNAETVLPRDEAPGPLTNAEFLELCSDVNDT